MWMFLSTFLLTGLDFKLTLSARFGAWTTFISTSLRTMFDWQERCSRTNKRCWSRNTSNLANQGHPVYSHLCGCYSTFMFEMIPAYFKRYACRDVDLYSFKAFLYLLMYLWDHTCCKEISFPFFYCGSGVVFKIQATLKQGIHLR